MSGTTLAHGREFFPIAIFQPQILLYITGQWDNPSMETRHLGLPENTDRPYEFQFIPPVNGPSAELSPLHGTTPGMVVHCLQKIPGSPQAGTETSTQQRQGMEQTLCPLAVLTIRRPVFHCQPQALSLQPPPSLAEKSGGKAIQRPNVHMQPLRQCQSRFPLDLFVDLPPDIHDFPEQIGIRGGVSIIHPPITIGQLAVGNFPKTFIVCSGHDQIQTGS